MNTYEKWWKKRWITCIAIIITTWWTNGIIGRQSRGSTKVNHSRLLSVCVWREKKLRRRRLSRISVRIQQRSVKDRETIVVKIGWVNERKRRGKEKKEKWYTLLDELFLDCFIYVAKVTLVEVSFFLLFSSSSSFSACVSRFSFFFLVFFSWLTWIQRGKEREAERERKDAKKKTREREKEENILDEAWQKYAIYDFGWKRSLK